MPSSKILLLAGTAGWLAGCASSSPAPVRSESAAVAPKSEGRPATQPVPSPAPAPATATAPAAPAASIPAPRVDSTSPDPRPEVVVGGMDYVGVRTRLIPHVMAKGWMLSVNKGDSIEFLRPANPDLALALFGIAPPSGSRIRLRFRLRSVQDGVRLVSSSHLLGPSGPLPYRASEDLLARSLEDLKSDLQTAPVNTEPQIDRVRTRKK